MRKLISIAMAFAVLCLGGIAAAQNYPNRPIRVIYPTQAGAPSSAPYRLLMDILQKELGQPVVLDHRPGADGLVAYSAVVTSPADGYVIGIALDSTLNMLPHMTKTKLQVGVDYTPLLLTSTADLLLTSHSSLPFRDLKGLIAYAKANPGKLNYGTALIAQHLYFESLAQAAGVTMQRIPYKGSAQALVDRVTGEVHMWFGAPADKPHVDSGKLVAIASTGRNRLKDFPDTPTLTEAGYPDMVFQTYWAFIAPPGLPAPIAARLTGALNTALGQPELIKAFQEAGQQQASGRGTPEELASRIKSDVAQFGPLIQRLGLKAQ